MPLVFAQKQTPPYPIGKGDVCNKNLLTLFINKGNGKMPLYLFIR